MALPQIFNENVSPFLWIDDIRIVPNEPGVPNYIQLKLRNTSPDYSINIHCDSGAANQFASVNGQFLPFGGYWRRWSSGVGLSETRWVCNQDWYVFIPEAGGKYRICIDPTVIWTEHVCLSEVCSPPD